MYTQTPTIYQASLKSAVSGTCHRIDTTKEKAPSLLEPKFSSSEMQMFEDMQSLDYLTTCDYLPGPNTCDYLPGPFAPAVLQWRLQ